jgi:hypothetical protein
MQWVLETSGPMGQVGNCVLSPFFFLLFPEGGGVSLVQTDVSWEVEVSPLLIITFWGLLQSTLQVLSLNNRPNCC